MRKKICLISQETQNNITPLSDENLIKIKRIEPTNTLFFLPRSPMGCERQTAKIRNRTITCMEGNDIRSVAYRYLQNKSGEGSTRNEAIFYGFFSISAIYFFLNTITTIPKGHMQEDEFNKMILLALILLVLILPVSLNVPPNVCNTLRYRETKDACKDWLTQKLGKEDFQQIKKLSYNRESFFKINKLLDKKEIPPALPKNAPSRYRGASLELS